jgi:hypothetical protein
MPFHALSVQEADFPPELAAVTAERITRGHLARIRPYHQSENRQIWIGALPVGRRPFSGPGPLR